VTLAEQPGLQLVTNLVGVTADEARMDMAVRVDFEQLAPGYVIPVFRPAEEVAS
jgi:hypothetical protein